MPQQYQPTDIATFRADDAIVEIVPDFDLPMPLPLYSSSVPVGPFKAGIATKVPLWMALVLEQRSLARISPPSWLSTASLTAIIRYERREAALFHDETQLPRSYYELAQRLLRRSGSNATSSTNSSDANPDAMMLLVQDLLDIRLDKLRQQFQSLVREHQAGGHDDGGGGGVLIEVNGMGTYEMAVLHNFVTRALADRSFLEEQVDVVPTTSSTTSTNDPADRQQPQQQGLLPQAVRKSQAPLRKFRTGRN
jgi:hypothetical protein